MDLQFYGANCVSLTTKHGRLVVDDNLADLGSKSAAKAGDIALFTGVHATPVKQAKITIDQPGEYEVAGISVYGIAARGHMDEAGGKNATMYKIISEEVRVLFVGHVYPELSDAQLEAIGMIDVMVVPVGGNGYTLDGVGALSLIKKVEPKLIVPTNYDMPGLQFPVPQQTLEQALQAMAMEPAETVQKLKLKHGNFAEAMQLIVVQPS